MTSALRGNITDEFLECDRIKQIQNVGVICGWSPGSLNGPFTEHNVYVLGRETSTLGWQWSADPNNSDEYRFDCRMADPRCA